MLSLMLLVIIYVLWVVGSWMLDYPGRRPRRRTFGKPPRKFSGELSHLSLGYGNPAWHARMEAHRIRVDQIRQEWRRLAAEHERELVEWMIRNQRRRRGWRILLPL